VYSSRFDSIFLLDGGVTNVTVIDPWSGAVKGEIVQAAAGGGSLDAKGDREWLYVLKGDSSVSVSKLTNGGKGVEVQEVDLSALGSRQGWQGLAIYPSSEA